MSERARNYARAIYELNIPEKCVHNSKDIILSCIELQEALLNPAVKNREKHAVIDKIFDKEIRNFFKTLCDHESLDILWQIFDAYDAIVLDSKNMIKATITFVTKPDEYQLGKIKEMVCRKYNKSGVELEMKEDMSLIGGFVLTVGDIVYDKSIKGTLSGLYKTLVGGEVREQYQS
jgi:F-type H+-transporting ATPase subunit delta